MLAALGGLASWAVPKLISFVAKKFTNTPIGQHVSNTIKQPAFKKIIKQTGSNLNKMMNNTYNDDKTP